MEIVCLIVVLAMVISWAFLPGSVELAEAEHITTTATSIGDASYRDAAAA